MAAAIGYNSATKLIKRDKNMSDYFSKCNEINIIKYIKECAEHYNFKYDTVLLSECYISIINSDKKQHITHRIDTQDNIITFLINSNNVQDMFKTDKIYFYQQEEIMTILKDYTTV